MRRERHPWLRRISLLVVLTLGLIRPLTAVAAEALKIWLDKEVTPWLTEQLSTHPRFKGLPLQISVMRGGEPESRPDGLSLWMAERLGDRLAAAPGIHLLAPGGETALDYDGSGRIDCRPSPARYLLAVETDARGLDARVQVRVLDLDDRSWVAGFSRSWNGRLTSTERRRLGERHELEWLRGQRSLPFASGQPDLMASRIAASLACDLRAHPAEDLRATVMPSTEDGVTAATAELVAKHLARAGVLRLVESADSANVLIRGEAHDLEDGLRQVWVSVRPASPDEALPSIAAAAYVGGVAAPADAEPGGRTMVAQVPDPAPSAPVAPTLSGGIEPLRLLRMEQPCESGQCSGPASLVQPAAVALVDTRLVVEVEARTTAEVYLLALRSGRGLVRMAPAGCDIAAPVQLPAGTRLRHPLFSQAAGLGDADSLTVFAVVVGQDRASGRIRDLVQQLPSDCGGRALNGAGLERWNRALAKGDGTKRSGSGMARPATGFWRRRGARGSSMNNRADYPG